MLAQKNVFVRALTARQFSSKVIEAASEARAVATEARIEEKRLSIVARTNQDEQVRLDLKNSISDAAWYECLAARFEYLRDIRLPLLPPNVKIPVVAFAAEKQAVGQFLDRSEWSLKDIDRSEVLLNSVDFIDEHIPYEKLSEPLKRYQQSVVPKLRAQVHHEDMRHAATQVLQRSKTAMYLMDRAYANGYRVHFVDMTPYNLLARDKRYIDPLAGYPNATALCSVGYRADVFVDAIDYRSNIARALSLAHEYAHAWQYHDYLKIEVPFSQNSAIKKKVVSTFGSTLEAHAIAIEYIVAAELLMAGVDEKGIHDALPSAIKPEVVNLLISDKAEFLYKLAKSAFITRNWQIKSNQNDVSPQMIRGFAAAMPSLPMPWLKQPRQEGNSRVIFLTSAAGLPKLCVCG